MGAHLNLYSWNFQPKPTQNPHPIAVRPKPTQTQEAVAVPLLHGTPVDITYSRVFVKICRPTQAHPGPPMKSWAHPKPTLNPMGLGGPWVWVGWVQNSRLWSQHYMSTVIEKYSSTTVHCPNIVAWYYSTLFHVRWTAVAMLPDPHPTTNQTLPTAAYQTSESKEHTKVERTINIAVQRNRVTMWSCDFSWIAIKAKMTLAKTSTSSWIQSIVYECGNWRWLHCSQFLMRMYKSNLGFFMTQSHF